MREDDATDVILGAGGVRYTLQKLRSSTSTIPTPEEKKLVERTLGRVKTYDGEFLAAMANFAVKWNDKDLWMKVFNIRIGYPPIVKIEELLEGWRKFRFENVRAL